MSNKLLRLKELRGKKTQEYIARHIGITQRCYQNYESGSRQADYDTLIKLSQYFGVSIDYLLGVTPDSVFTAADYASGITDTQKERITAIEMLMLDTFRQIGTEYGEQGQERAIEILKLAFAKGEEHD